MSEGLRDSGLKVTLRQQKGPPDISHQNNFLFLEVLLSHNYGQVQKYFSVAFIQETESRYRHDYSKSQ